ncbi:hypothetical protein MLD38_021958 [Melastoma candidum]|nr:hypothetical protein MLD38_021958 [Melastoma candidum]
MISVALSVLAISFSFVLALKILNALWLNPKRLEKFLRRQGLSGTPYRLLVGDILEIARMNKEALSTPMPEMSHDLGPRLLPLVVRSAEKCGEQIMHSLKYIDFGGLMFFFVLEVEQV